MVIIICFSDFVDWLVQTKQENSVDEAILLCQALLDCGIIHHGTSKLGAFLFCVLKGVLPRESACMNSLSLLKKFFCCIVTNHK